MTLVDIGIIRIQKLNKMSGQITAVFLNQCLCEYRGPFSHSTRWEKYYNNCVIVREK